MRKRSDSSISAAIVELSARARACGYVSRHNTVLSALGSGVCVSSPGS
ncbi:hypothetical protein [Nonomuraea polychroma]|nr:hypothetical protein [Nonomuraea polychroma]